jgi:hypothetical protein
MLRRLFVPILAAVTLTLVAPMTAQADTLNLADERGDVHRIGDDGSFVRAEGERRADILRTRIQHTDRALVVRTSLLRLRREGANLVMAMRIRTNEGTYREVQLEAGRRIGWGGEVSMNNRRGAVVACRAGHNINYTSDVMALRIPSSCLNSPRWVQMTLVSLFVGGRQFLADNPHNHRMRINVWTPRIRRG